MSEDRKGTSRRDFLKLAGTGVPAAAVATVAAGGDASAMTPETSDTIQKTEHVRKYLDSARF